MISSARSGAFSTSTAETRITRAIQLDRTWHPRPAWLVLAVSMSQSLLWCCFLVPWLVACTNNHEIGIDRDVENRLTISSGVYGQTTAQDDVGVNPVEYNRMTLSVSSQGDSAHLAEVTSDDIGFYEIPLSVGSYAICTSFGRCADFEVVVGQCVRLDYEFSVGPGWETAKPISCPK